MYVSSILTYNDDNGENCIIDNYGNNENDMKIIAIFLLIFLIVALILIGTAMSRRDWQDFDAQYYDEEGDHVYYDRSLKEKKWYARLNPQNARHLRTFRHLFR